MKIIDGVMKIILAEAFEEECWDKSDLKRSGVRLRWRYRGSLD